MLDNPCPGRFRVRIVDHSVPLVIRLVQHFGFKPNGPVFQGPQAVSVIGVNRPGVDHALCQGIQFILVLQVVAAGPHLNPLQHALNHPGISALGNSLVQGIEVIVVKGQPDRNPPDNKCRQLVTGTAPLLFCVSLDQFFVNIPAHQADRLLLQVPRLAGDFPPLFVNNSFRFLRCHYAPHAVERVHVERQGIQFAPIVRYRAVRKPVELRKAVHILPDLRKVCMKDMGAVHVDVDSFHPLCVRVSADVRPPLDHQHAFSRVCQFPRGSGAVQARADNQIIIHELPAPRCFFGFLPAAGKQPLFDYTTAEGKRL